MDGGDQGNIERQAPRLPAMTLEQAERIFAWLERVGQIEQETFALIRNERVAKYLRRSGLPFQWAWAYELSLPEVIGLIAHLTDSRAELAAAALGGYDAFLNFPDTMEAGADEGKPKRRTLLVVLSLLYALMHSLRAIGYHSRSMDELLEAGLSGHALSLRRAVAIDATALAMPRLAAYVSSLRLEGRSRELRQLLQAAAKGPNKQLEPYRLLRYYERILREGGIHPGQSREQVYELVVRRLRLYDARGADAFKGLFTLFDRWKADATT